MNRFVIEYHSPDDRALSLQLMAAAMRVLAENNADTVNILQEDSKTGSTKRFAYAGGEASA